MNENLVICPTVRKDNFIKMAESFYKNSLISDLIVLRKENSITELINAVNLSNYKYVTVTNDDFIYHTHGWDCKLIEAIMARKRYGMAFGNDGVNRSLPTHCLMTTNIPQALGWVQLPGLEHLCGDMVWQYIGQKLNCLYYVPEVSIEHCHFLHNKAEKDEVYQRTNSMMMYKKDNDYFRQWILNNSYDDIQRIKRYMADNKLEM